MTHTEPPPALDAPAAGEPRCPACLSLHRPGQTYCLECGNRLTDETGLPPPSIERGATLTPGRRLAIALAMLLLILIGALIAWAYTRDDDQPDDQLAVIPPHSIPLPEGATVPTAPTTTPTVPTDGTFPPPTDTGATIPTGSGETIPTFSEDLPSTDETEPPATTEDQPPDEEPIDEWPAGRDGWATILISKEVDDFDNAYMEDLRSDAQARGLTNLGLLYSSNWSTLNPGFRVLYQGPFDTRQEADRTAVAAQGNGYEFAYPRHVAP